MESENIEQSRLEFEKRKEAIKWAFDITYVSNDTDTSFWRTLEDVQNFLEFGKIPDFEASA